MITLHIYRDRKREWRWTLKACNGRKLANCGEGYRRRSGLQKDIVRVFGLQVSDRADILIKEDPK